MFGKLTKQKYLHVEQVKNYKFKIKFVDFLFVSLLKYVFWSLKKKAPSVFSIGGFSIYLANHIKRNQTYFSRYYCYFYS